MDIILRNRNILPLIFVYLRPRDLKNVAQVSQLWCNVSSTDVVWARHFHLVSRWQRMNKHANFKPQIIESLTRMSRYRTPSRSYSTKVNESIRSTSVLYSVLYLIVTLVFLLFQLPLTRPISVLLLSLVVSDALSSNSTGPFGYVFILPNIVVHMLCLASLLIPFFRFTLVYEILWLILGAATTVPQSNRFRFVLQVVYFGFCYWKQTLNNLLAVTLIAVLDGVLLRRVIFPNRRHLKRD